KTVLINSQTLRRVAHVGHADSAGALYLGEVSRSSEDAKSLAGRSPRAAGHLSCRLGGRGGTQSECRSLHHLRELLLHVRPEPFLMPKTPPERLRDRPQTSRCAHEREGLKAHSNHAGLASLPEDRIDNAILESRVKALLRRFLKPVSGVATRAISRI